MGKKKRRVTLDIDGEEVLFRIPTVADLWAVMRQLPTLPDPNAMNQLAENVASSTMGPDDIDAMLHAIEEADRVLARCAKKPVLLIEGGAELVPGTLPLDELDPMARIATSAELLTIAGFGKEAAEKATPFSETAEGSQG